ncbi:MAG: molybdopterin biosynthesis protein [Chloroflexota bacterium]|nr:molybdopterin biosynthesis protein [Chloroflexota bacterium]NOG63243.1 molybdopterin biosynthesis protein [Chloroflexota bacterium]GIK64501.1 MAG: molybdopterin biosynthesis protein [Chloroflexota bacterium]
MAERNIYLEDIPLDEAQVRLMLALEQVGKASPLAGEEIPLSQALGRITAAAVWAKLSSPHYHSAAMDGYAVQAEDTLSATETRPIILQIDQQAFAINTGDPLPPATNAVIKIEDVQPLSTNQIEIRASVVPRQHVRLMGEDMVVSELVLPANHKIRPVDLGAIAGCGYSTVLVRRQPRVQIIPTGSELVPVTQTPQPGQIIEYNSLVLAGQIQEAGVLAAITDIVSDTPDNIRAALKNAIEQRPDLILVLSGSSAGSKDFTASIIREMGQLLVHGVAVRPGHPVIIGLIENIPVIGVPGYPVSAALTGEIFIQPLLAHWLGQPSATSTRPRVQAIMTRKLLSPIGDDDFVRVTLAQVGERLLASPLNRGAGVITSLVKADGLAHIPRFSEGVDTGQPIDVLLYRPLHEIQQTILAMGSHDPMLDLLAEFLAIHYPGYRLASANVGSSGGLVALRRQEAHLAGVHLLDPQTGTYNIPYLAKYLPNEAVTLVNFAHREQGFIVAAGNPHKFQGVADLSRVRFVNRQRGAGTRLLLDYELQRQGILPESIAGYDHEEITHLAVAAAVASGVADCGMGVRSAASAMGLDFIPLGWEQYDLVIPDVYQSHPGIQNLLSALSDPRFHQLLGEQPGYDTRQTGQVVFP